MNYRQFHDTEPTKFNSRLVVFCASIFVMSICACAVFLLLSASAAERSLPRNSLWEVVHNLCVPGHSEYNDPKPSLRVDLTGGIERGFAILRDPRGGTQFLLIPTARISGIESPFIRRPHATNYFADAWEARSYRPRHFRQTLRPWIPTETSNNVPAVVVWLAGRAELRCPLGRRGVLRTAPTQMSALLEPSSRIAQRVAPR